MIRPRIGGTRRSIQASSQQRKMSRVRRAFTTMAIPCFTVLACVEGGSQTEPADLLSDDSSLEDAAADMSQSGHDGPSFPDLGHASDLGVASRDGDGPVIDFGGSDAAGVCRGLDCGPFAFSPPVTIQLPPLIGWRGIAAGDLDADGRVDLVVSPFDGLTVLFNEGAGKFAAGVKLTPKDKAGPFPVVADFNGDGRLDVAGRVSSGNWIGAIIVINSGGRQFQTPFTTEIHGAGQLVTADLNLDGKPDVTVHARRRI
jgi:hypothetical protein